MGRHGTRCNYQRHNDALFGQQSNKLSLKLVEPKLNVIWPPPHYEMNKDSMMQDILPDGMR